MRKEGLMSWRGRRVDNSTLRNLGSEYIVKKPSPIGTIAVIETKMNGRFIAVLNKFCIWDDMSGSDIGYDDAHVDIIEVLSTPKQLEYDSREIDPFEIGDRPHVTRVEVVDDMTGQVYARSDVRSVQAHLQDGDSTLKVFLRTKGDNQ